MLQPGRISRALLVAAIYGSQPLSAIDLSKFGAKNADADRDAAIEDARKLVNAMNDAATGTITSYEPGHGPKKAEVVTCDEIMAKSLVVANEEKAEIIAEKAAVVKAAALLSDRIDELSKRLKDADDRIAAAEEAFSDLEQITQSKLDAAAKEADERIKAANDAAAEELERMKLNMSALKNSTAVKIERMEQESEEEIKRIRVESEEVKVKFLKLHQEDMEALRKETAKKDEAHERKLAKVTADAESEIEALRQELTEKEVAHERQMAEVNEAAKSQIATIKKESARMIQEISDSADAAVASAAAKHKETSRMFDEALKEAQEKEIKLSSSIAELTTESSSLQNEVTFWKDTHNSQGYCNTTLIREDSRRLVINALAGTQKLLNDGVNGQVQFVQEKSANVVLFIEEELIPKVEKAMGEACEIALEAYNELSSKALVLYNEHLAATINEKIVPVLDEHVYPVWNQRAVPLIDQCTEHVSPIVKTIDNETRKKVTKAREGIAPRLESLASSFIEFAQKKNLFDKLPKYMSTQLMRAADDGQWALDSLFYAYLVLVVVLFRSTIFRIIWFFCPLRLFFRKNKPALKKTSNKESSVKSVKAEQNGSAKNGGKAKVY
mmetsp:Transcript_3482/g.5796  ORF Transcript_3482/g.5796 Transcript_3482/m.5796 type:complete len:613 (-) Transcript_3482:70-1908(-)